jgi:hypothetical protein
MKSRFTKMAILGKGTLYHLLENLSFLFFAIYLGILEFWLKLKAKYKLIKITDWMACLA